MKNIHKIREDKQIKLLEVRLQKIIKIVETKKLVSSFEPSLKVLSRIMLVMTEKGSQGRTQLSLDTNLNYARLAKHIVWLEKKNLVKSIIDDNKITIILTDNGRMFASTISKISSYVNQ